MKHFNYKHGGTGTRLYRIWQLIKDRTLNKNSNMYKGYGDRGIDICEEWLTFESFKEWSLNNGYKESLTIDRRDNNEGYNPFNCRWTTKEVQARNTRRIMKTNTSGFRGVSESKDGKRKKRFQASIRINGKDKYIGRFMTALEAGKAYDKYVIDNNLEHTRNFNG